MKQKYCIYGEKFLQNGIWRENVTVHLEDGRIAWLENGRNPAAEKTFAYITPGLVDNHIHGGDGVSVFASDPDEIASWLVKLAEGGNRCGPAGTFGR